MVITILAALIIGCAVFIGSVLAVEKAVPRLADRMRKSREQYLTDVARILDDLYATVQARQFQIINAAAVLGAFVILIVLTGSMWAALAGGIAGALLPPWVLNRMRRERLRKFNLQLVQACETMSGSLKAGYAFAQAMAVIVDDMPSPIRDEFAVFLKENTLGVPVEEALERLTERVQSSDMRMVATAILLSRQTGANLAEILGRIAASMRERNKMEGQVRSLTAQGRLSGLVVGLLPVFLVGVIYMIDPALVMPLFNTTVGNVVLVIGAVMETAGALWIRRLLAIDF